MKKPLMLLLLLLLSALCGCNEGKNLLVDPAVTPKLSAA